MSLQVTSSNFFPHQATQSRNKVANNLYFKSSTSDTFTNNTNINKDETSKTTKISWKKIAAGVTAAGIAVASTIAIVKARNTSKLKAELTEVYDRIFDELYKDSDFIKKIGMEKPKLVFANIEGDFGCYIPGTNTFALNLKAYRKHKFVAIHEAKGEIIATGDRTLHTAKELKQLKNEGRLNDFVVKELTEADQKVFFATTAAHELRHSVQIHTIFHTKDVRSKGVLEFLRSIFAKDGKNTPEQVESLIKNNYPYIYNYKNNNHVDNNIGLISAIKTHDGKKTMFASKEHFWKGYQEIFSDGYKGSERYVGNPLEIDANAFAASFIVNHKDLFKGCNDKMFTIIHKQNCLSAEEGLKHLESLGYPRLQLAE